MEFEWDDEKAASNLAKHGVEFEVVEDFDWGEAIVDVDDRVDYGETRLQAIGRDGRGILYLIVFTPRREKLRIISARRANRREVDRWHNARGT